MGVTVAIFLFAEFMFALFFPQMDHNTFEHFQLNHAWRPHSKSTVSGWQSSNPEFKKPYVHFYNAQGWVEDHDISLKKPQGTYRIFYVGDSFVEGTCPMGQSVPSLVGQALNERYKKTGYQFEVINTGTVSYSPVIYYLNIKYYLLKYQPDVVVVNVDMSDDYDDWKYRQKLLYDKEGEPFAASPTNIYYQLFIDTEKGPVKATWLRRGILFLYQYSHLYNWLLKKFHRVDQSKEKEEEHWRSMVLRKGSVQFYPRWSWCKPEWDPPTRGNVAFTMGMLEKIIKLCQANHVKVLLSGTPYYGQFLFSGPQQQRVWSKRPHEEIEHLAKKYNVPYLDSVAALEPFIRNTTQDVYYYINDPHFNPKGYALWARAYIDTFNNPQFKLLPEDCYQADLTGTEEKDAKD